MVSQCSEGFDIFREVVQNGSFEKVVFQYVVSSSSRTFQTRNVARNDTTNTGRAIVTILLGKNFETVGHS